MTSPTSVDRRKVHFVNEQARREYEALPRDEGGPKEEADAALTQLQNGRFPHQLKHMKGALKEVVELKMPWDGNAYRAFLAIKLTCAVYILGAIKKKSPKDSVLPQNVSDTLIDRARAAKEHHMRTYGCL